ncbi:DUF2199 domain-containing protein [Neolewinella persica]|uniref:DUF2199 domain-containing protein n=1 Tax=Neolewinella persica TaxID=70998 RepID=UPI00036029CA|nr:DUF2199 domain-containing protein [Neolewinella persica]
MTSYHCETCNKDHKIFRGLEIPPPALITEMPEAEKAERIHDLGGLVGVDKLHVFINGYIYIFLEGKDNPFFSWHTWAALDQLELRSKLKTLIEGEPITIAATIPCVSVFYDSTETLDCTVTIFPDADTSPDIVVTQPSQLQQDQAKPITLDRMKEIMNRLHHAGDFSGKQEEFKEPFAIRFNQLLDEVTTAYADKGDDFYINLQGKHSVSFQLVNSGVLEEASDQSAGFGIDLPFDLSDQELVERQQRFLALPLSAKFTRHDLNGIPTYQFNVGEDRKLLTELVIEILSSVFQEEIKQVGFDHDAL